MTLHLQPYLQPCNARCISGLRGFLGKGCRWQIKIKTKFYTSNQESIIQEPTNQEPIVQESINGKSLHTKKGFVETAASTNP